MKVELSNRHIHLCEDDFKLLFGENGQLTVKRALGKTEFAANETLTVQGSKGSMSGVRILGPCRSHTQVELLAGDCRQLGIDAPVLESVNKGTGGVVTLVGPQGSITRDAAIVAHRHVHANEQVGEDLGLENGAFVKIKVPGVRGLVFENTIIRFHKGPLNVIHLDVEEGNAAGLKNGDIVEIIAE